MIGSEKTSKCNFHNSIVRANKKRVNVPFKESANSSFDFIVQQQSLLF